MARPLSRWLQGSGPVCRRRAQVDSGRPAFNNPAMVSQPLNLFRAGRGALFATRLCENDRSSAADGGHDR